MYFYKHVFLQIFQTKTIDRIIDKRTPGVNDLTKTRQGFFLRLVRGTIKNMFRWLFCEAQAQHCRFSSLENPYKNVVREFV